MEARITLVESNSMHAVLAAPGRSPEIPEPMDVYGWLIGSWELDVQRHYGQGMSLARRTIGKRREIVAAAS